jgi:polysaccharide deacetylase 2 family uncharacterized protein YibQ
MAPQSKKNSKPSSNKKKPATKKVTPKKSISKKPRSKQASKKKKSSSTLKRDLFISLGLFFIFSLVLFAYFLGQGEIGNSSDIQTKKSVPSAKRVVKKPVAKPVKKRSSEQKFIKEHEVITKKSKPALSVNAKNPKLVIIIDDVHTKEQISAIRNLNMKITPSIFPPYNLSPNSHRLAQGLKHYMIHLPMESGNSQFNKQYKTLKVSFSNKKIENRIKELRLLFPQAKYINNHTGSVFTSDYAAMHLAYRVMKENGFIFVDSRTINTSKVKAIAQGYGDVYLSREIFIDNEHSVPYIHQQLKKAVEIAKRKGFVIAIGHPHASTMKALATAGDILDDVELVYIDEL